MSAYLAAMTIGITLRRTFSAILGFTVVAAGLVATTQPAVAAACSFSTPSPLPSADGRIETAEDLQWLWGTSSAWTASWEQTADIDMGGCTWDKGIADSDDFSGTYDGAGFTISGLSISGTTFGLGLFKELDGATVSNLTFEGSVTSTDGQVGALAGRAVNSQVSNVHVTGDVQGAGVNVGNIGGLLGRVSDSTITDSSATGNVTGTTQINHGGLIGLISRSSVSRSFATGNVTGVSRVGGLLGDAGVVTVTQSFATGDVTGTVEEVGGLVGYDNPNSTEPSIYTNVYATGDVNNAAPDETGGLIGFAGSYVSITNAYSTGSVDGNQNRGGLVGAAASGASATNSYWDTDTSQRDTSALGEGKTTNQMQTLATFANWSIAEGYDASKIWGLCPSDNNGYPFLVAFYSSSECGGSSSNAEVVAEPDYTFQFRTSGGGKCLPDVTVTRNEIFTLPPATVACTPEGTSLVGWSIPGQTWAFQPGRRVRVVDNQVFTAVARLPQITVTYDANVGMQDQCTRSGENISEEPERSTEVQVDRTEETGALATAAPCTPPGFRLSGWTNANTPAGSGQAQEGAATYEPGSSLPAEWNASGPNPTNSVRLFALWTRI